MLLFMNVFFEMKPSRSSFGVWRSTRNAKLKTPYIFLSSALKAPCAWRIHWLQKAVRQLSGNLNKPTMARKYKTN